MVGITSYGAYIPWNRLNRKAIYAATGWFNSFTLAYALGEKAVASYDEDSLSMSVAAGMDCLKGVDGGAAGIAVEALYLSSTTLPYRERQNAGIAAAAMGLPGDIRAADFTGSLKAGTAALLAACESAQTGGKSVMVCAADCRLGKPGSVQEQLFDDGAAAFLVGGSGVIAAMEGFYSLSADFVDHRRAETDGFDRAWEERWIRDEGYGKFIPRVVKGLLEKYGLKTGDFARIIYPCPYGNVHTSIGKIIGAEAGQLQDNLMASVGDAGVAHPLLMLAAALEEAMPGDRLLVVGYGNGCDALIFRVTAEIEKFRKNAGHKGIKGYLARRRELNSYEKYASFRGILPVDMGIRGEEIPATAFSVLWRERKAILSLAGSRCRSCGTPQYPPQRVCVNPGCGATDDMEDYSFAWKKGRIFTFTADNLAASGEPPAIYGIVDFEGGGRFWFDFADCELKNVKVGAPVEMTFRRKYLDQGRGVHGYFWN